MIQYGALIHSGCIQDFGSKQEQSTAKVCRSEKETVSWQRRWIDVLVIMMIPYREGDTMSDDEKMQLHTAKASCMYIYS